MIESEFLLHHCPALLFALDKDVCFFSSKYQHIFLGQFGQEIFKVICKLYNQPSKSPEITGPKVS